MLKLQNLLQYCLLNMIVNIKNCLHVPNIELEVLNTR